MTSSHCVELDGLTIGSWGIDQAICAGVLEGVWSGVIDKLL